MIQIKSAADRKLCAVSVDLDEIRHYRAIHGLGPPAETERSLVYELGLGRLTGWATSEGLPLTWFVVGADLDVPANASRVRALAEGGDEIGCHSQNHFYDLTRRPRGEMQREVEEALDAIERVTGTRAVGFRAPGYTVSDALFEVLSEAGVQYDSSVFPCPSYYALKALAQGTLALRGRRSQSVLDTPEVLTAPVRPYRVGRPYYRRGAGLLELPIQVTRGVRLPFIGTTLALAGPRGGRWLARGVVGEPLVNLELHGIDALDVDDGLGTLGPLQRDLRVPHTRKLEAFSEVVRLLRTQGYSFVLLREAARYF